MKIAIFSDTHLGYPRFEEDSYIQAEYAIVDASKKADLILCAGDIFDTKIPKLETLKNAFAIFKKSTLPIFAIFGNHERRAKGMVNPVHLLSEGNIELLHGKAKTFEKNNELVQVFGLGSIPEEYAEEALKKTLVDFKKVGFSILMIHQSIKELMVGGKDELSLEYLEQLPFDLIINGHIHETINRGKFLIPGSTVITQLKKEETAPKGYFLYDTKEKKAEFVEIPSRKFFYEKIQLEKAGEMEINVAISELVLKIKKEWPNSIIAIKIEGTLKDGLKKGDLTIPKFENVYVENRLDSFDLASKLEKIREQRSENLSIKEIALKEMQEKTRGKINFDGGVFFEKLLVSSDEALQYIEKQYNR